MNLSVDVIVDGEYLLLPKDAVERARIITHPFSRLEDGAVKPRDMQAAIDGLRKAGYSIGYRTRRSL